MTESNTESIERNYRHPLERLTEGIQGLSNEHRSLLLLAQLGKAAYLVEELRAAPQHVEEIAAALHSTIAFAGLTAKTGHDQHEKWTSTGDKRVDDVWDIWVNVMSDLVVSADSLPEDLRERIKSGEASEEDLEEVMRIIGEKTGLDTSDMGVDVIGAQVAKAKDRHDKAVAVAEDRAEKVKGTADYGSNLYL